MSPKILLIAPCCFPPSGSEAIVNAKLVFAMLEKGWQVDVISSDTDGYGYPTGDAFFWKELAQVSRVVPAKSGWNLPHLFEHARACLKMSHCVKGLAWAGNAYPAGDELCRETSYDLILSRTVLQSHLLAMKLSRKHRIPWVANWNDPFPASKFPSPYGEGASAKLSSQMVKALTSICRNAPWHTFPCQRLLDYMTGYLPVDVKGKSSVVPHIALCDTSYGRLSKYPKTDDGTFKVCHTGNLDQNRDPSVFLAGLKLFLSGMHGNQVKVTFIGKKTPFVERKIYEYDLKHIIEFSPAQNYYETLPKLDLFDVALIIEAPCAEGIFLPSKTVDYLQMGLPILAVSPECGTLNDIIKNTNCGWIANNVSAESVRDALSRSYAEWRDGTLSLKASQSLQEFSTDAVLAKYSDILNSLHK